MALLTRGSAQLQELKVHRQGQWHSFGKSKILNTISLPGRIDSRLFKVSDNSDNSMKMILPALNTFLPESIKTQIIKTSNNFFMINPTE
jgi:hypothetical protein